MKTQLSLQEWELLSAYLDGQLSQKEQAGLEQRLRAQPELHQELESLRQTRAVLRSVPQRRVPHNFTLTRAMAQAPPSAGLRWLPALRFSSAVATVLVVLSVLFELLPRAGTKLADTPSNATEPMAAAIENYGSQTPTPIIITWGFPGLGGGMDARGGGGGGDYDPYAMGKGGADASGPAPELLALPEEQAAGLPLPAAPEEQASDLPLPLPEATPSSARLPEIAATATLPDSAQAESSELIAPPEQPAAESDVLALEGSGPILGIPPIENQGRILATQPALAAEPLPTHRPLSDWRLIQAALALVALASGLAAYLLQRKLRG